MKSRATHAIHATGDCGLLEALESAFATPSLPNPDNATHATAPDVYYGIWQERAAILTYEAGYTKEIAEAAAVIFCISPPAEIDLNAWQHVMDILGHGLDDYARQTTSQNLTKGTLDHD